MPHILSNQRIELHIDLPEENYQSARFDWTGKIVHLSYKGKRLDGIEITDRENDPSIGRGFYNEFGIDSALGFEEAQIGEWFHKIGIGLLKKTTDAYHFHHPYEIRAANFEVEKDAKHICMRCSSEEINGYAYVLKKDIHITNEGFAIQYLLQNTGEKAIITKEYNHNFLSLGQGKIGPDDVMTLDFSLQKEQFGEYVNPEEVVQIGSQFIKFSGNPKEQFFCSNLSGDETVQATWTLLNHQHKLGISERGDFQTDSINLWGWAHVISPELFIRIHLEAGQFLEWSRRYQIFELD